MALGMRLDILAEPPAASADVAPVSLRRQVWRGGAVDRETRTMIASPARWLVLHDLPDGTPDAGPAAGALLSWNLIQVNPGDTLSPDGCGGLALVSMDVDENVDEEFSDWYNTEHIPLLSKVPGMICPRRFVARRGSPRYVALYHIASPDVYAARAWSAHNETPWMLRMRRFQRNRTYFIFHPEGD